MHYEEPLIRPPSEADSLIFQVTLGCSHNKCLFCFTYHTKQFRTKNLEDIFSEIDWCARQELNAKKVFLADGDALGLPTDWLLAILWRIRDKLPSVRRVSAYASPVNLRHKSVAELTQLREAGLGLLYVGLESGDDEVLTRVRKGALFAEMAALAERPHAAAMKLFVTVVLGLGGPRLSARHAAGTAKLLDAIRPRYAAALSLMLPGPQAAYAAAFGDPSWRLLSPVELLGECRALVAGIDASGIIFYSNHASNYLALEGVLQKDKPRLLAALDAALEGRKALRPERLRGL